MAGDTEGSRLATKPHHSHLSMDWGTSIQSDTVSLLLISVWFTENTRPWHPADSSAYSHQSRLGNNEVSSTGKLIGCAGPLPFLPCPPWVSFHRVVSLSPHRTRLRLTQDCQVQLVEGKKSLWGLAGAVHVRICSFSARWVHTPCLPSPPFIA